MTAESVVPLLALADLLDKAFVNRFEDLSVGGNCKWSPAYEEKVNTSSTRCGVSRGANVPG